MNGQVGRSWLAWIAILGGALWAASCAVDLLRLYETTRWPRTAGVITTTAVVPETSGVDRIGRSTRRHVEDRLHMTYAYTVAGQSFTGTQFNMLMPSPHWDIDRARRTYPVGQQVEVRYDPDNHAIAVLDSSVHGGRVVELIFGLVVALAAWMVSRPRIKRM
jgi:hypothetical protein